MNFIKHSLAACCLVIGTAMGAHALDETAAGMADIGEAMDAAPQSQMMTADGTMVCKIWDLTRYGICLLDVARDFQKCMNRAETAPDPQFSKLLCEYLRSIQMDDCKAIYQICRLVHGG